MPTPLKPGETPEEFAEAVADDLDHTSRMGGIVDRAYLATEIAAALKEFGDRRGEEERAKALEEAARLAEMVPTEQRRVVAEAIRLLAKEGA